MLPGDLRTDVGGLLARIPLSQRRHRLGEPHEELIVDRVLDEEPRAREADLTGVIELVHRLFHGGIEVVFGGGPNEELGGLYYRPTLFREPPRSAEIVQHEVFGPVLTIQRFGTEDEGVALANDTTYGLSAIVYTGDPARAERVSSALVAGTVWVNSFYVRDLRAPFGGSRNSGIGREGGFWSFDFYSDVKNVCMAPWT